MAALFETEKLNLAAYLIASGSAELVRTYQSSSGAPVTFALSRWPSQETIASFFTGTGVVSALKYSEALTNLKSAVFETKRAYAVGGQE